MGVILKVAWMAVLLGLVMQLLTAAATQMAGANPPAYALVLRDLSQRVTWAMFACVGLALGMTVTKARSTWTGLFGLLAAPLAFVLARAVHRSVASALNVAPPDAMGTGLFAAIAIIKALEYGTLGFVIVWLCNRTAAHVGLHIGAGLGVGVLFGTLILAILVYNVAGGLSPPKLVGQAVNEILFPVGCSLVLFASNALGRRLQGAG